MAGARVDQHDLLRYLVSSLPALRDLLLEHRFPALSPARLGETIAIDDRAPAELRAALLHGDWHHRLAAMPPARALAIVGQARWSRAISPEDERRTVSDLLSTWAIRRAVGRAVPNSIN